MWVYGGVCRKQEELQQQVEAARRAVRAPTLSLQIAEVQHAAAGAELAAVEARIAADRARYGESPDADVKQLAHTASRLERTSAIIKSEADVLDRELALATAEAKPTDDANRAKEIGAATKALAAARTQFENARKTLSDDSQAENYTPFSAVYPQTSTGRRRALAQWMTSCENPLTARVAVNHIWMRHFLNDFFK